MIETKRKLIFEYRNAWTLNQSSNVFSDVDFVVNVQDAIVHVDFELLQAGLFIDLRAHFGERSGRIRRLLGLVVGSEQIGPSAELFVERFGIVEEYVVLVEFVFVIGEHARVRLVYGILRVDAQQKLAAHVPVIARRNDEIIARRHAEAFRHLA